MKIFLLIELSKRFFFNNFFFRKNINQMYLFNYDQILLYFFMKAFLFTKNDNQIVRIKKKIFFDVSIIAFLLSKMKGTLRVI